MASVAAGSAGVRAMGYSFRTALLWLVAVPLIALFVSLTFDTYRHYKSDTEAAYRTAHTILATTVTQTELFLDNAKLVLAKLAARPLVRELNAAHCDPLLAELQAFNPAYANLLTLDAQGKLVCSVNAAPSGQPAGPDPKYYFDEVVRTRQFVVGKPARGFVTGRWVSTLAYPIINDAAQLTGVVAISVDLANYEPLIAQDGRAARTEIGINDSDRTVIARTHGAAQHVGTVTDDNLTTIMTRERQGTTRARNDDGDGRFYAFAPIAGSDWIAFVSLDEDTVLATVVRLAVERLAFVTALVLMLALITTVLARRIARPVEAISRTIANVGAGAVHERVVPQGPAELRQIAAQLNEMLDLRLRAETLSHQSEERYRTLIEWTPEALVVHDGSRLIYANPAAVKLAGARSLQDLVGMDVFNMVHPDSREIARKRSRVSAREGGTSPLLEQKYLRLDGTTINVEVQSASIVYDGTPAVHVAIHDITARKQAELVVARTNRALRTLNACNEALIRAVSETDLLNSICRLMVEIGGYPLAWVGIAMQDAVKTVRPVARFGTDDGYLSTVRISWADDQWGLGPAGTAIRTCCVQVTQDFAENAVSPMWRDWAITQGYRACIALPLKDDAGAMGALTVYARENDAFDAAEVKLLVDLANNLSYGIKSLRTHAESMAFADELRKLSLIVEQSPESIVITNLDGSIEYVNEAFVRNSGYSREEAIRRNPRILHSGKTPEESYVALWATLAQGQPWRGEFYNRRKDGSEYVERAIVAPIRNGDGLITHYMAVKEDITERKISEDKIHHLAFYDQLTDLPNRRLLLDRLQEALTDKARDKKFGALLYVDLDNFKTINDTLGHPVGDQVLQQVAMRLSACVGVRDTVASLGGDDFLVLLVDAGDEWDSAVRFAGQQGEKILRSLRATFRIGEYQCQTSSSIGITLWGHQQDTTENIFKQVDLAMYASKAAGRNTLRFFDTQMQELVNTEAALEVDLRVALNQDQFRLYYQAQIDDAGHVLGAEALLRWQHPTLGLVMPGDFISLAERTRLILPLGKWVLETACAQLKRWESNRATAGLTLAVNISAIQLHQPDFVADVLATLAGTQANPNLLKLELTESVLLSDMDDTIIKMTALRHQGVRFSLDDFGTGYSSLSYLRRLELDQLKIDQSFIREIPFDSNACVITRTIVALGRSLGLTVIAEGVETEAQRLFLLQNGCHLYQGYLLARPLPLEDFMTFVAANGLGITGVFPT